MHFTQFAASNDEVHMTTKLEGLATRFLPFNKGDSGAAGNPLNPKGGHRTAYLWEEVWERESWLGILGRYHQKKVFDSVLVVSDRNVIDQQLQQAIFDFEGTVGVLATIKDGSASKSGD